jgi:hypothetical protein
MTGSAMLTIVASIRSMAAAHNSTASPSQRRGSKPAAAESK